MITNLGFRVSQKTDWLLDVFVYVPHNIEYLYDCADYVGEVNIHSLKPLVSDLKAFYAGLPVAPSPPRKVALQCDLDADTANCLLITDARDKYWSHWYTVNAKGVTNYLMPIDKYSVSILLQDSKYALGKHRDGLQFSLLGVGV